MRNKAINPRANIDMPQRLLSKYALRNQQVLPEILILCTPPLFVAITQVRVENQSAFIATSELD
jgi:hypothetical protein